MTNPPNPCLKCGGERKRGQGARGLCINCYRVEDRAGNLDKYPIGAGGPPRHGSFTLAVKNHCECDPCQAYRRAHLDRANARIKAHRDRKRDEGATTRKRQVWEIGNPELADEVLIDRIRHGRHQGVVTHPDDRAGIAAAADTGTIPRNAALTALNCSGYTLDSTILTLHRRARNAEVA